VANDEWRSLILFALYTGQRLGDLARLCWSNLDLVKGEVRLVTQGNSSLLHFGWTRGVGESSGSFSGGAGM